MATKHDDKCLMKADDDEPIFVLRAQDRLAPSVVRHWADLASRLPHEAGDDRSYPRQSEPKVAEALALADAMEDWQKRTGRAKWPD